MNHKNFLKAAKSASLDLAAGALALTLITACTDRSEKTTTTTVSDTTVTAASPAPVVESETGTTSGTTAAVDSGKATDTTDAMTGSAPATTTTDNKIIPKKSAKVHKAAKVKSKKKVETKTETTTTHSDEVGAVSPIYDSTDETLDPDMSASGATSSAMGGASTEVSTTVGNDYSQVPGRMASALTDWGVDYRINDAAAASRPE